MSFMENMFGEAFLQQVLEWVADNYDIDEIYGKQEIEAWLKDHFEDYGYVEEQGE